MNDSLPARLDAPEAPSDQILMVDGTGDGKTRGEFHQAISRLRSYLDSRDAKIVLFDEDPWLFAIALTAAMWAGKSIVLPGFAGPSLFESADLTDALFLGSARGFIEIGELMESIPDTNAMERPQGTVESFTIEMLTSGSTGEPQSILKTGRQIDAEVDNLIRLWGDTITGTLVCSTVSHQHLYGFLFALLVPLCAGIPILREHVDYPEYLEGLSADRITLVSSPAFLKRIDDDRDPGGPRVAAVYSSGGPLPASASRLVERRFRTEVWEVYGSTETGGVAYRRLSESETWTTFDGVEVDIDGDGHLIVKSSYLDSSEPFLTSDLGEGLQEGSFRLLGRSDSVVKIEEKRVSLKEMSEQIESCEEVGRAEVLMLEGRRQYIGAVVVLSEAGENLMSSEGRRGVIRRMRSHLKERYSAVLIPRKWRFVRSLPVDTQGKIRKTDLEELFLSPFPEFEYDITSFDGRAGTMSCRLALPPDHRFFRGHFPGRPILPAVAQVYIAVALARHHLGLGDGYGDIPRMKFAKPIVPGESMDLDIELDPASGVLGFRFRTVSDGRDVSSGRIRRRREDS